MFCSSLIEGYLTTIDLLKATIVLGCKKKMFQNVSICKRLNSRISTASATIQQLNMQSLIKEKLCVFEFTKTKFSLLME